MSTVTSWDADHQTLQSGTAPDAHVPASTGRGLWVDPSSSEGKGTHTSCTADPPSAAEAQLNHWALWMLEQCLWWLARVLGMGTPTWLLGHADIRSLTCP